MVKNLSATPSYAFGAKQLCDGVRLQVVDALHADLVLPGSRSSKLGLKITVDAAFLKASRINDCRNLTTVIVQLLCLGVEGQDWGATAVKNMLHGAQSPKRAFKLRCWFGKDGSIELLEHFIPYIKQALALDATGLDADLLQLLPPRLMGRDAEGRIFVKHLPICWRKGDGKEKLRRVLVRDVHLDTSTKVATDGATMFAAVGTSIQSGKHDPGTDATVLEQQQLLEVYVTGSKESFTSIAEKIRPGCPYTLAKVIVANRHTENARLAAITRWPEQRDHGKEAAQAAEASRGRKMSKAEQQQLRRLWGDLASDGRGEEAATHVPDWVNPTLKKVCWQPLSSKPTFDTSDISPRDAQQYKRLVTQCLKKGTILRVPVASEWGERNLQETFEKVWGEANMKFEMLGLCILHCLQRSIESNLKLMIAPIQERFIAARGGAVGIIETQFNAAMKRDFPSVRLRIKKKEPQNAQCKECADVGVRRRRANASSPPPLLRLAPSLLLLPSPSLPSPQRAPR